MEWGDVLRVSQRGLWASRRFLWDRAARNIAALLACPSAWDGDHFLQVWRQIWLFGISAHHCFCRRYCHLGPTSAAVGWSDSVTDTGV